MNIRALKFGLPLAIYLLAYISFTQYGWLVFAPVLFAFFIVPSVELLIPSNEKNLSDAEEQIAKEDRLYDFWLYAIVPLQYTALYFFMQAVNDPSINKWELAGRILAMGLLCGTFGINVGHELGHRRHLYERNMAKALLLTSLYMHFYIEHNKGHHKNVSTHEDPSSARKGEHLYRFYLRTVVYGYISAWKIAADEQRKKGRPVLNLMNQMIQFQILQLFFLAMIFAVFGTFAGICFLVAATIGFLLLETVNYIEHYGLERKKTAEGYERAMPEHSWNSNHFLGRLLLFELSRHSDHHYQASRKYQLLRHHDDAPQMPTGYPGMIILAMFPPIWFQVMHRRMDAFRNSINN